MHTTNIWQTLLCKYSAIPYYLKCQQYPVSQCEYLTNELWEYISCCYLKCSENVHPQLCENKNGKIQMIYQKVANFTFVNQLATLVKVQLCTAVWDRESCNRKIKMHICTIFLNSLALILTCILHVQLTCTCTWWKQRHNKNHKI